MKDKIQEAYSWGDAVNAQTYNGQTSNRTRFTQSHGINMSDLFGIRQMEDERSAKAGNILPFPLETVSDKLADATVSLLQAKAAMLSAYSSGLISSTEKQMLKSNINKIKKIKEVLKKIAIDLSEMGE